jgi:sugar lactone lactonase YvrE
MINQHRWQPIALAVSLLLFAALASPTHAQGTSYQMIDNWFQLPEGFKWGQINSIDIDSDGNVYVLQRCGASDCIGSSEPPLLKFDNQGKFLWSWGVGMVVWPHGLDLDADGNIWITDGQANEGMGQQVLKVSPQGGVIMRLGTAGVTGDGHYTFDGVADVVVAKNGDIFVADGHGNNRVVKYSADGTYITEWGKRGTAIGEFNLPHAITMDSMGRILVADRDNFRIQVFDQNGKFLDEWHHFGRPGGIEIDAEDNLYVAAQNTDRNPTLIRGLYVGNAIDGFPKGMVNWYDADTLFNSEAVSGTPDGVLYAGFRPMPGTDPDNTKHALVKFVPIKP